MRNLPSMLLTVGCVLTSTIMAPAVGAQTAAAPAQAAQGRGGGAPAVVSPDVSADRRITFRINAPQAQAVRVSGGDIPGLGQNGVMTKGENGVWTFTSAPVPPGAYRYNINVGRRGRDRSAQSDDERVEQQRLEPCAGARIGHL